MFGRINNCSKMKINKLLFGMLLLLLASCGSSRKVEKQSEQVAVQEINLTPEQQRKYDYFFLEASRLKVKKCGDTIGV